MADPQGEVERFSYNPDLPVGTHMFDSNGDWVRYEAHLAALEEEREKRSDLESERAFLAKQISWEPGHVEDERVGDEECPVDYVLNLLAEHVTRAESAEKERDALREALEEIVRIYNDDSLTNSAAQDRTDAVARAALPSSSSEEQS